MPDESEVLALLALMLLNDARRARPLARRASSSRSTSRTARCGTSSRSPKAARCSSARTALRGRGPYVLQAAIADLHLAATPRLGADRRALRRARADLTGSPVVELNRAIAIGEIDGPEPPSPSSTPRPRRYRYFHSTRAELLRRLGRDDEARLAYARALELTDDEPEQRFLASAPDRACPGRRPSAASSAPPRGVRPRRRRSSLR